MPDQEELHSQNRKPTNDSQENRTKPVKKVVESSNLDLRNTIEVSATESNSSDDEKELGKQDDEYNDLKNSLNCNMPDIESLNNNPARLIDTTEGTVTCDLGCTSDNSPELEVHKSYAHDGVIFLRNQ